MSLSKTLSPLLMASALEGSSWKCWHWLHQTQGKFLEASLQSQPRSTPTLPPKPCHENPVLLTKALRDLQEIQDKQNKQHVMIRILLLIKQLPLFIWDSKEAALTSLTLNTLGPTGGRWGASLKHCNPHHASAKSFLQRWAHANSERLCLAGCVGLWTVHSSLIEFCCEYVRALSAAFSLGVLNLSIIKLT